MKILIISARYHPETFSITNIAERIVELGHDVTVLTGRPHYGLGKPYPGYEKNVENEIINGVKVIRVKERIRKKGLVSLIFNYLSIKKQFKKKLKKLTNDFDVVISHVMSPIFTMEGIKTFCEKNNTPHIHYGLDLWPESFIATGYLKRTNPIFKSLTKYCKKLYLTCDTIIFASPSTEYYFKKVLGLDIDFKHIYQPCLTCPPDINLIKTHTYKKDGKLHILYCGTVGRFHYLHLFIKALSLVPEILDLIHVDIVGSGSQLDFLKHQVNDLNLNNVVTFHGRVSKEETAKFYLDSDVLYVPLYKNSYTSDMIPQKVIEYFMYGKPIFGTLEGDGLKLIKDACSGNAIASFTPEGIADSLRTLTKIESDQLCYIGLENRKFFEHNKRFFLSTVCDEIIEVCQKNVDKRKNS